MRLSWVPRIPDLLSRRTILLSGSRALLVILSLTLLCGQQASAQSSRRSLAPTEVTVRQTDKTEVAAKQYCGGVQEFVSQNEPLLFAAAPNSGSSEWRQMTFEEWQTVGRPLPAASVWLKTGHVVAVKLSLVRTNLELKPVEYCYWDNGNLAHLSLQPQRLLRETEASRKGIVVKGQEQFYSEDGAKKTINQDESEELAISTGQKTFVYINATSLEYRSVRQLPFAGLLDRTVSLKVAAPNQSGGSM